MGSSQDDWQQMTSKKKGTTIQIEGMRDNISGDLYDHMRISLNSFIEDTPVSLTTALGVLDLIKRDLMDEA